VSVVSVLSTFVSSVSSVTTDTFTDTSPARWQDILTHVPTHVPLAGKISHVSVRNALHSGQKVWGESQCIVTYAYAVEILCKSVL
jgi:hypothetical protein